MATVTGVVAALTATTAAPAFATVSTSGGRNCGSEYVEIVATFSGIADVYYPIRPGEPAKQHANNGSTVATRTFRTGLHSTSWEVRVTGGQLSTSTHDDCIPGF